MNILPTLSSKEPLKKWARSLTPSQRRLLSLALVALVANVLVFGMLIPSWNYRSSAVEELRRSTGGLEWMQSESDRAQELMEQIRLEQTSGTELPAISRLAQASGFRRQVLNRTSGGVTVDIPEGEYSDLIKFLSRLSIEGYSVVQLKMESLRSGRVNANLKVRR